MGQRHIPRNKYTEVAMPTVEPEFTEFETIEAVVDLDEFGLGSARVSYYARDAEEMITLLRSGKSCPLITADMLQSAKFLHGSASSIGADGIYKVDLFWRGAGKFLRLDDAAVPQYSPSVQTSPIDTHYLFEEIAGTPAAPKPGAQFDDYGGFVRFNPMLPDGEKNPKAGVTSWYNASLTVSDRRGMQAEQIMEEDVFAVGKIQDPDVRNLVELEFPLPGFEQEQVRDFLLTSVKITDLGQGFGMIDRRWDMSGPFGWDKDIYDYEDDDGSDT